MNKREFIRIEVPKILDQHSDWVCIRQICIELEDKRRKWGFTPNLVARIIHIINEKEQIIDRKKTSNSKFSSTFYKIKDQCPTEEIQNFQKNNITP